MMDTLTRGIRHQASGIRHQASGIRHQASGKKSNHRLIGAFLFLVIVFSMLATGNPAYASGTLIPTSPSSFPPTVDPVNGTLTYYGAANGYLSYISGMPVGSSEEAVAWETVSHFKYSTVGFAKTGSGTYGGVRYSMYQDNIGAYPYQATQVVTQYVCPPGSDNGTPAWYTGQGMPNARKNPNECCTCGYRFEAAIQKCVLVNAASCLPACPANSTLTGSTCTCNDPYVSDANGTSCVNEQYTLAILGSPLPDVVPGSSGTVVVRVTNASNEPKSDVKVRLKVNVEANSGGHGHHDEQRPKGSLSGAACDPPENHCATAITDSDGLASFSFAAPDVSGKHTVTAACLSHTCTGSPSEIVKVKVDGLKEIPGSPLYVLIKKPGATHGNGHFLTPEAATVLQDMASSYYLEYLFVQKKYAFTGGGWGQLTFTPSKLYVNDASLVWGGRFDFKGNWSSPHAGHRRGVVIDVRANENTGAIPQTSFTNFQNMAVSYGAVSQVHCTSNRTDGQNRQPPTCVGNDGSQDTNRHMHILLLGVDR